MKSKVDIVFLQKFYYILWNLRIYQSRIRSLQTFSIAPAVIVFVTIRVLYAYGHLITHVVYVSTNIFTAILFRREENEVRWKKFKVSDDVLTYR